MLPLIDLPITNEIDIQNRGAQSRYPAVEAGCRCVSNVQLTYYRSTSRCVTFFRLAKLFDIISPCPS